MSGNEHKVHTLANITAVLFGLSAAIAAGVFFAARL
jgi:hypothetical protein